MAIVPAAAQALSILRFLSTQAGPVPAAAISREVSLPRSTTYHLLETLMADGFVMHFPDDRRYGLGLGSYELGSGYSRHQPLQRQARLPLAALVDRVGHNAHLAVMHGNEVVYVIEERASGKPPLVTDVGVRLPAQLTASGRAMLAMLPNAQVRALFPDSASFVMRNERGPRSLSALRQHLVETRRVGYAVESGEVTDGFSSVAVAVTDYAGQPVAAVAVTYPDGEVDSAKRAAITREIMRTVRELQRRVGVTPMTPPTAQPRTASGNRGVGSG